MQQLPNQYGLVHHDQEQLHAQKEQLQYCQLQGMDRGTACIYLLF